MKNTYFFIVYKLLVFMNFPVFVFKKYIVCTIVLYHPNTCFICIPPTITAGISTNLYQTNKALSVFTYFQYKPPLQFYFSLSVQSVLYAKNDCPAAAFRPQSSRLTFSNCSVFLPFRILSFFYSTASSTASFSASVSFIISLYFLMMSTMI